MNLKELKEILQLLDEKEITEFELEEEGMKLRVRKASPAAAAPAPAPVLAPQPVAAVPAPAVAPPPAPAAPAAAPPAAEKDAGLVLVKSPIVGTFYRTPDPNSPPFVSVGDKIRPGQVMCIIEAMKLMNEIESELSGEVVTIHHESGQPVQYGDPLFSIRPA
ncbi:MAG: acetyl-CoA carboxylase biotin carboxyl carrier protein [Vicinamibacteria bacterium]